MCDVVGVICMAVEVTHALHRFRGLCVEGEYVAGRVVAATTVKGRVVRARRLQGRVEGRREGDAMHGGGVQA